ncbi:hypothetical protein ACFOD9_06815 [Novosphingobium bradum]|uniref:Uncharacterized protein n=1 Tax=Novosphingobium bradum TaxID=1737444 RepID=A0ABV7IMP8_9SPHN
MLFTVLIAAQLAAATSAPSDLPTLRMTIKKVSDQTFECMDEQTKVQLGRQEESATPDSVVDLAMETCSHLRNYYANALVESGIEKHSAIDLTDQWFNSLREAYRRHVEEWLLDPKISDLRVKLLLSKMRKCIDAKSSDWSRLGDAAETVGKAAVTSCISSSAPLRPLVVYYLRSKKIPESNAESVMDNIEGTMKDVAVQTVISKRASRLPKR